MLMSVPNLKPASLTSKLLSNTKELSHILHGNSVYSHNMADQNQIKSIYLTSVMRGVVARSLKPKAHVSNLQVFQTKLEFRSVGF